MSGARPRLGIVLTVFLLAAAPLAGRAAPAVPAGPVGGPIPRDARGLPLWRTRVWNDFPVRIELSSPAALAELLRRVPLADFDREQVRPRPGAGGLIFEPRVTDAELAALAAAGYVAARLPDREREGRQAIEAAWAAEAAKGGAALQYGDKGVYHTADQVGQILQQVAAAHPEIARYYSLGNSVEGRPLHALEISRDVGVEAPEPEVRLASTIHGNEPVQLENLLDLADYLTANYGADARVTGLVDSTDIHIVPCLNPDGLVAGLRDNAHGVDLNRNFPVPNGSIGDDGTYDEEPETIAIENHGAAHHFVVSETGHTGALVVNYPWDYTFTRAPDDSALVLLSLEYSSRNPPMFQSASFPDGIVRGALWYVIMGSLQDWSYQATGCVDLTIETSDVYMPPAGELDQLWIDNRESLLHLIAAARYGVRGTVTDASTGLPLAATVTVTGNAKPVATDPAFGDYYKLLPAGTYALTFAAPDHAPRTISGVSVVWGASTVVDAQLEPAVPVVPGFTLAITCEPNPFNGAAILRLRTSQAGRATLAVFDARGRLVRRLFDQQVASGDHPVPWDGAGDDGAPVPSGPYFARFDLSGAGTRTAKLTLAR